MSGDKLPGGGETGLGEQKPSGNRNPFLELLPNLQPAMDVLILLALPAGKTLH